MTTSQLSNPSDTHTRLESIDLYNEIKQLQEKDKKNEEEKLAYHHLVMAHRAEIASYKEQLHQMQNLFSWKLVKPIRWFELNIRRIIKLLLTIPWAIADAGSIGKAYQKSRRIYKAQGFKAVKRHLLALNSDSNDGNTILVSRTYAQWIHQYDTLTPQIFANLNDQTQQLPCHPLISIIMPTYNPDVKWLAEAIESVRNQIYPQWELCIADDCSTNIDVRTCLEHYAKIDSRIKVAFREKNGHISIASNTALELATGEWIALLDHDDVLPAHALFYLAQTINNHPEAQMIYSDEDKIDESGNRFDPYFKCDWNIDLFYSQNMFSHLGAFRHALIKQVGGFRAGLEGSQDYDLAIRCIEHVDHKNIHHIPRVLYHWRVHAESTAKSGDNKPYAALAGLKALNEHFERTNVKAHTELLEMGAYRTHYALPESKPLVSLIIPTRNGLTLLQQCISSILEKTTYNHYEIIIVDNASDDPEVLNYFKEVERNHKNIKVIHDSRPFNYSQLNNSAIAHAKGEIIGLINNDIEVIEAEWLSEMVSIAIQPNIGSVGAKLLYNNTTVQHAGVVLGIGGVAGHAHKNINKDSIGYFSRACLIQSFSAVTAACLIVKRSIFEEVGGLDEENLKVAFNDVDFCLKVREAGYRNVWTPYALLYHHESVSRGHEDTPEKVARFNAESSFMQKKWGEALKNDPAYNPNLTLEFEDFSLAWPPRLSYSFEKQTFDSK